MEQNRINKLNQYSKPKPAGEIPPYVNLFLFGTHGSWKTVSACQIGAHRGKVLLHTADNDWISLRNHPEILANVDVVPVESPLQTKLISEAIRDQVPPYDQYATFVLDTLGGWVDEFIEILLKDIKYSDEKSRTRVSGKNNEGIAFARDMNLVASEFTDFNLAKAQLRPIVRNLVNAPINVVFNAHDRVAEKDKGINWKHIRPDMPEQCFTVAVRKCDSLGFIKRETDGEPIISFKDARNVTTKSRLGVLNGKEFKITEAIKLINKWMDEEF